MYPVLNTVGGVSINEKLFAVKTEVGLGDLIGKPRDRCTLHADVALRISSGF